MAKDIDVYQLLKQFAAKVKSPTVDYAQFASAVKRHASGQDMNEAVFRDLAVNPDVILVPKLSLLARSGTISLKMVANQIQSIELPDYYLEAFSAEYKRIDENPDHPFPDEEMLKMEIPPQWIQAISIEADLAALYESERETPAPLYRITFPDGVKAFVIPSALLNKKLCEYTVLKIRQYLRKSSNKEFIQNKLSYSFSGKEIALREAMNSILSKPYEILTEMKNCTNDFFYQFWAYLMSYLKKDLEKKTEKTNEDWSIVQSVYLSDFFNAYFRGKAQKRIEMETAFKNLEIAIRKPPYAFSREDIDRFVDTRGIPLLGKYDRSDLDEHLKEKTKPTGGINLPEYLVVNIPSGRRLYVAKDRILPLAIRLSGDARTEIRKQVISQWKELLADFETVPAMEYDDTFRSEIRSRLAKVSPTLDKLIEHKLLVVAYAESRGSRESLPELDHMFIKGELAPIDVLLSLDRKTTLGDAKMLLPIWYGIPILSKVIGFFARLGKRKRTKEAPKEKKDGSPKKIAGKPSSRRAEFVEAVSRIEKEFVPEGISIEEHLKDLESRWNTMINDELKENLSEDVRSLVRDHVRGLLRTLTPNALTSDRVKTISSRLSSTPSLMKIKNHDALEDYILVYMLKILKKI